MFTPIIGIVILCAVFFVAVSERSTAQLDFIDYHAAFVVLGGVAGALCLSIERSSLIMLLKSIRDLLPGLGRKKYDARNVRREIAELRDAWRGGQRSKVLDLADQSKSPEIRVAADALFKRKKGAALTEAFAGLRTNYISQYQPVIEGWDLVGRLAPSFGMVGTVTGMIQLFKNMAGDSGNIGGAMGMALLATLYGITFGAAVGSPMATRVMNRMNEYLATMELLEQTISALTEADDQSNS
jgi:flagellar motor component MotA